jgi:uncharacterized membrane protein
MKRAFHEVRGATHRFQEVTVLHRFGGFERGVGWYWVAHAIFTFAIIAALVALVVWFVTNARRHNAPYAAAGPPPPPAQPAQDPALLEARMRYARGEMSREDYLRIVADLTGAHPPAE